MIHNITADQTYSVITDRNPESTTLKFSLRLLNILLAAAVAFLLIFYLAMTTHMSTLGFTLKTLEKQANQADNELKSLRAIQLDSSALTKISESAKLNGFVAVSKVDYIDASLGTVATR